MQHVLVKSALMWHQNVESDPVECDEMASPGAYPPAT